MVTDVKSYNCFPSFKQKVLEIRQREINELIDINIYFEPITKDIKVVNVKFHINQKNRM